MRSEVRVFPGPPFEDGGIAQLARAPALQAGGQEFDSLYLHQRRELWNGTSFGNGLTVIKLLEEVNKKCILNIEKIFNVVFNLTRIY